MSGDDKFMTRWVVKMGWKMRMQLSPECTLATTFKADGKFFKQILRWTRNTWRSDFKSLVLERVIWWRYPVQVQLFNDCSWNPPVCSSRMPDCASLQPMPWRSSEPPGRSTTCSMLQSTIVAIHSHDSAAKSAVWLRGRASQAALSTTPAHTTRSCFSPCLSCMGQTAPKRPKA
jgi:hypothetical protein